MVSGSSPLLASLLVAIVACNGGSEDAVETNYDDTAREISSYELAKMTLTASDFGPEFGGFEPYARNGLQNLDQAASDDFDPPDERTDLERSGFESSYQQFYSAASANPRDNPIDFLGSIVTLFKTAEGAANYFRDSDQETSVRVGRTNDEGVTAKAITAFDTRVAGESSGVHFIGVVANGDEFSIVAVAFRRGRLLGTVAMYGSSADSTSGVEFEEKLARLAVQLDEQMGRALASTIAAP